MITYRPEEQDFPKLPTFLPWSNAELYVTKDLPNSKFEAVYRNFQNELAQTIKANLTENHAILEGHRVKLIAQKNRMNGYITVHNNFINQLKKLIDIKNTSKPENSRGTALHANAKKSQLIGFLKALLILKEWNINLKKTSKSSISTQEKKRKEEEKKSGRIVIDQYKDPLLYPPNDPPYPDNHTPSLVDSPFERMKPPHLFDSSKTVQPTTTPSQKWGVPFPKIELNSVSERFPISDDLCQYKMDLWHVHYMIQIVAQLTLMKNLKDKAHDAYCDTDFKLYKDRTSFQGASSQVVQESAAHLNFRPQSYDRIAYTVLRKIGKSGSMTPFETIFLKHRHLLKKENNVETLKTLYKEFNDFILDPQVNIDSSKFKQLTQEKFILITSIFAKSRFELTSNTTCQVRSYSNYLDGQVEVPMELYLANEQNTRFSLPLEVARSASVPKKNQQKQKDLEQVIAQIKKLFPNWREGCLRPAGEVDYEQDSIPPSVARRMERVDTLVESLIDAYIEHTLSNPTLDAFKKARAPYKANFENFADELMSYFMNTSKRSETELSVFQSKIGLVLDTWLNAYKEQPSFAEIVECVPTPHIEKLEETITRHQAWEDEYLSLEKYNNAISLPTLKQCASKKEVLAAISAYPEFALPDSTLKADSSVKIKRALRDEESIVAFQKREDVQLQNAKRVKELAAQFRDLIDPDYVKDVTITSDTTSAMASPTITSIHTLTIADMPELACDDDSN